MPHVIKKKSNDHWSAPGEENRDDYKDVALLKKSKSRFNGSQRQRQPSCRDEDNVDLSLS